MKQIRRLAAGAVALDHVSRDAYFLHEHGSWKPEDLGYPPRDYILIDLMRQMHG